MPLENQVEWETLVFPLIMHKIQEEFRLRGSVKLWSKVLWTWFEVCLFGPFDILNVIGVISPVNN